MDAFGELLSGTVAGLLSKIVEHPFDTVKVRLQAENSSYRGTLDCIRHIVREEGVRGFYRGVAAPIAGAAFENSGAFLFYGRSTAWIRAFLEVPDDAPTPLPGVFVAGGVAGVATGSVLTPVELLKCRVQDDQRKATLERRKPRYRGVLDCGIQTVRSEGATALFTGYSAALVREIPGTALWFGSYELALRYLFTPAGKRKDSCPWYAFPISGIVGGVCYWSCMFPMDSVKTRIQIDPAYQALGIANGLRTMVKRDGLRSLYAGYVVTVLRAFPSNATIFTTFELTQKWWKGHLDNGSPPLQSNGA